MEYKITNRANFDKDNYPGEANNEPSQTIPNQSMSLQDLVDKFTITSNWPKVPQSEQFDSEQELPDIQMMSKTEVAELQLNIKQDIVDHQIDLKNIQNRISIQKAKQKIIKDNKSDSKTDDQTE